MLIRSLHIPSLAIAVVLFTSVTAQAVTLSTPFVRPSAGQSIRILVTNLGKKDITVTVTLTTLFGDVDPPNADDCTGTSLAAGATCPVIYVADHQGFATVTSSGKVRAAINVIGSAADNFPLVTVVPATK